MADEIIRPVFGSQTDVRSSGYCSHSQMLVDDRKRIITCGTCSAVLDPFDCMAQYAHRERSWKHWRQEASAAEARVEALKAEERKVKARLKATLRKDANEAVAAERARTLAARREMAEMADDIARLAQRIRAKATRPGED